IRARWMENGQNVERTRHVNVHAGGQLNVDFMSQTGGEQIGQPGSRQDRSRTEPGTADREQTGNRSDRDLTPRSSDTERNRSNRDLTPGSPDTQRDRNDRNVTPGTPPRQPGSPTPKEKLGSNPQSDKPPQ